MSSFVRKDFYINPPDDNATEQEWREWMRRDDAKARADKARHTKSLEQQDIPDHLVPCGTVKIGGVHRQMLAVGMSGNAEDNDMSFELIDHTKDTEVSAMAAQMEHNRNKRGGRRTGKSARRRKNRKGVK